MSNPPVTDELADIAIGWFVRLRAEDVTAVERKVFFKWLREARLHQQAFVEIQRLWVDKSVVKWALMGLDHLLWQVSRIRV